MAQPMAAKVTLLQALHTESSPTPAPQVGILAAKGTFNPTTPPNPWPPVGGTSVPAVTALPASDAKQRGWYKVGRARGPPHAVQACGARRAAGASRRPALLAAAGGKHCSNLHALPQCPTMRSATAFCASSMPNPRALALLVVPQVNAGQTIDDITCFSGYQRWAPKL